MMSAKKGLISICSCILFALVFCKVTELGLVCNKGFCEWKSDTIYTGCPPDDVSVLEFTFFFSEQLPRPFMHIGANGKHTVHGTNIQQSDVSTSNTEADFPSDW